MYTRKCVYRTLYMNLNLFYDYMISEIKAVYVCINPQKIQILECFSFKKSLRYIKINTYLPNITYNR